MNEIDRSDNSSSINQSIDQIVQHQLTTLAGCLHPTSRTSSSQLTLHATTATLQSTGEDLMWLIGEVVCLLVVE